MSEPLTEHIGFSQELLDLTKKSVNTWGPMAQSARTVEKLSGMIRELCLFLQFEHDPENIKAELSNCFITLLQVAHLLDFEDFNKFMGDQMYKLEIEIIQHKKDKENQS
jgi:hypothetical protein